MAWRFTPQTVTCPTSLDRLNRRDDEYGGSIENRSRFICEIVEAIKQHLPSGRVGVRVSPFAMYNNSLPSDPIEVYTYLAQRLNDLEIGYLHFADMNGWFGSPDLPAILLTLRPHFKGPMIANGGIDVKEGAELLSSGQVDAVAFGRAFLANPDLVERIANSVSLNPCPAGGWYARGEADYTDFPRLDQHQLLNFGGTT